MTTLTLFNDLEVALEQAQRGHLPVPRMLKLLLDSDLAVPSATEVMESGRGFQPLVFPKGNVQMLACFTEKIRIGEYASVTPYCLVMKGRDLLRRIPASYGLVINPGAPIGFELFPDGIAKIVEEFA